MSGKNVMWKLAITSGLMLALLVSCISYPDIVRINQARGTTIINALYQFRQVHGVFPGRLSELIPAYLDRIPTDIRSQDFLYTTDAVDGFRLSFVIDSHRACGFTDQYKKWDCDYYRGED